eukprot:TRINITY_DN6918_c0_g1_i1.p1 TRINITY_DN6918_c0_g1~~TRINITY_DN6918_c0_g1_i1.p1  ORF type:complete len:949 (+),score=193.58 TRINITY_DN6918_c0_g1_i1:129-2975(+)
MAIANTKRHLHIPFFLYVLAVTSGTAYAYEASLESDNECQASQGNSTCALSALQRRGMKTLKASSAGLDSCGRQESCFANSGKCYDLTWQAKGRSFFDDFKFLEAGDDGTHGATVYVEKDEAIKDKLVEAHDTHAILRTGGRGSWLYKRKSVSLHSGKMWNPSDYFLVAMRFTHLPRGVGIWPAFWTKAPGFKWPLGSELDIMEWANGAENKASLHVSKTTPCKLDPHPVNKCGAFPESNQNAGYDCVTDYYSGKIGCGPNRKAHAKLTGQYLNQHPGVLAAEWTTEYIKVFYIPEDEIPDDLSNEHPRPATWDKFIHAYFPLEESDRNTPGSCQNRKDAFKPQEIVLNIGLCGDWAGMTWASNEKVEEDVMTAKLHSLKCKNDVFQPADDCCTQFMWDDGDKFGVSDYLAKHAFFNITWLKVFQQADAPPPAPPPPPPYNSCELAPGCVKVGLKHGLCCPAPNGMMMGCCNTMGEEACERHPKCSALGLGGACCPNVNGIRMGCCESAKGNETISSETASAEKLGVAACGRHPKCAALNLNGACCPNGAGVTMGCCEKAHVAPASKQGSSTFLGAAECGRHPKCAALHMEGACCPNAAGISMECCDKVTEKSDTSTDASLGEAACAHHPKCAVLNLTGACCPNGAGVSMGCCEGVAAPKDSSSSSEASLGAAACSKHPKCAALKLTGACCPNGAGVNSECCETAAETSVDAVKLEKSVASLGAAACVKHPQCAALNLTGACCPNDAGVSMGCCESAAVPMASLPSSEASLGAAACSKHPQCAALKLTGACCPNDAGVSMGCCESAAAPVASPPSEASLGAAACSKHSKCAALNLTGACCPNIAGVDMGCCDNAPVLQSSASSSETLGASACANHPKCAALKLSGACCPNAAGVSMGCCEGAAALESPPSSDVSLGAAACAKHSKCAALNLTGACCPTDTGISMGCCD